MTYRFPVAPHYELPDGLQTIDVIADMGCFDGFCGGNLLKYQLRAKHKGSYTQDLQKARDYMEFLLNPPPLKKINPIELAQNLSPNVASALILSVMALQSDKWQQRRYLQEAIRYLDQELQTAINPAQPITAIKRLREQGFSLGEAHRVVTQMNV